MNNLKLFMINFVSCKTTRESNCQTSSYLIKNRTFFVEKYSAESLTFYIANLCLIDACRLIDWKMHVR